MKKIIGCLLGSIALATVIQNPVYAKAKVSGYLYQSTAQAVSTAPVFNVGELDQFSTEVVASSATNAAVSFTTGVKSTSTIIVVSTAGLSATVAYSSITIASNTLTTGVSVTIGSQVFKEGRDWFKGAISTNTAKSLKDAIDASPAIDASWIAESSTVYSSASVAGSYANSWPLLSSDTNAVTTQGALFIGGTDSATVTLNGVTLVLGTAWSLGASTAATATNIAAAINANSVLSQVIVSTAHNCTDFPGNCGIVISTAITPGVNAYGLSTSSRPLLTPSGFQFDWGVANDMNSAADTLTKANTFTLGLGVLYSTTTNIGGTGLTWGTTYFIIPTAPVGYTFQLSSTSTGAVAGLAVDITTTSAGGALFTLTPSTYVFSPSGYKWQASDDGINFSDLAVSSITFTVTGSTIAILDMGYYNYRFLKFNYTAPARGGNVLNVSIHGKKDD